MIKSVDKVDKVIVIDLNVMLHITIYSFSRQFMKKACKNFSNRTCIKFSNIRSFDSETNIRLQASKLLYRPRDMFRLPALWCVQPLAHYKL